MKSGLYWLPFVLLLSAFCLADGGRFACWIAGIALALNVALIFFQYALWLQTRNQKRTPPMAPEIQLRPFDLN